MNVDFCRLLGASTSIFSSTFPSFGGSLLVLLCSSLSSSPRTCAIMFLRVTLSLYMSAPWLYSLMISFSSRGMSIVCVIGMLCVLWFSMGGVCMCDKSMCVLIL